MKWSLNPKGIMNPEVPEGSMSERIDELLDFLPLSGSDF